MRQSFNVLKLRHKLPHLSLRRQSSERRQYKHLPKEFSWLPQHASDKLPMKTVINAHLINQLERVALVDFETHEGIKRLDRAIRFADQMHQVDTEGVEPLYSILEDRALCLRDDVVNEGDCREELLKCAEKTIEEYYVAPPGNIVLSGKDGDAPYGVAAESS